jgi:glycosyltransferase involved in cell wall biosynthesis
MYPESLASQKRLHPHGHVAKILRSIDRFLARRCAGVIAISSRFGVLYHNDRGVATERIHVIPNWIDGRGIDPDDPRGVIVRRRFNLPANVRLALYGGNIGVAAGVETIIKSIRYLENESSFHLLVAGEGSQLSACQNLAQQLNINCISFYAPWPKDETSSVLSAADFLILPTKGQQSFASVPSKLITYMLSAKPVLSLAWPDSDLANIVEQSGCGWVVEPDRPDLLAAQIRRVMAIDASEFFRRGLAGRQYALANFSKEACLPKVIDILEQVAV